MFVQRVICAVSDWRRQLPTVELTTLDSDLPVRRAYDRQNAFQPMVHCLVSSEYRLVFAGGFRSKIITTSPFTITVPDDRVLKITNFTQQGDTERAVVHVTLNGDDGGSADVLAATRVDLSTGANSENLPEINNRVNIAGPAQVRIAPVAGARLLITYKKEPNEGGGEETTPIPVGTPTPVSTATPSATPSATPIPTIVP